MNGLVILCFVIVLVLHALLGLWVEAVSRRVDLADEARKRANEESARLWGHALAIAENHLALVKLLSEPKTYTIENVITVNKKEMS